MPQQPGSFQPDAGRSGAPGARVDRVPGLTTLLLEAGQAFLDRREWDRARQSAEQVLSIPGAQISGSEREQALRIQAVAHGRLGDPMASEAVWTEILTLREAASDHLGMSLVWMEIGRSRQRSQRLEGAREAFSESLRCSASTQPGRERATALEELGVAERLLGNVQEALRHLEESLRIYEALRSPEDEVRALEKLANAKQRLGRLTEAEADYERALALLGDLENPSRLAIVHNNLGGIRHSLGDHEGAIERFEMARALFTQLGERRQVAVTLGNLGLLHALRGENARALEQLEESLSVVEELGETRGRATVLNNLSLVNYSAGRYRDALSWAEASLESRDQTGELGGRAKPQINRARALLGLGDWDEAESAVDEALATAIRHDSTEERVEALLTRAQLSQARGEWSEAQRDIEQTRTLIGSEFPRQRAEALRLEARVRTEANDPEAARNLLIESETISNRLADPYHRALCGMDLGKIFLEVNSLEAAAKRLRLSLELFEGLENVPLQLECLLELARAECGVDREQAERRLTDAAELAERSGSGQLRSRVDETRALLERDAAEPTGVPLAWLSLLRDLARRVGQDDGFPSAGLTELLARRLELTWVSIESKDGIALVPPAGDSAWGTAWNSLARNLPSELPADGLQLLTGDSGRPFVLIPLPSTIGGRWICGGKEVERWTADPFRSLIQALAAIVRLHAPLVPEELEEAPLEGHRFQGIVYSSRAMADIVRTIERVAQSDASVLIRGESGTGKELVARSLHELSDRKGSFVAINCPSVPKELIEAELFGSEKGAFTGADRMRPGQIERADGGTLFLDEIGDMELAVQTKLLRFLEERELFRVGGREAISVETRLVAATSRDLEAMVASGEFRTDLLHRIMVVPISLPPLRERPEDVSPLVRSFAAERSGQEKRERTFDAESLRMLGAQSWPGNVRELRNVVHRIFALSSRSRITLADVPPEYRRRPAEGGSAAPTEPSSGGSPDTVVEVAPLRQGETLPGRVMEVEGRLLRRVLEEEGWNQSQAARRLGIKESTIRDKVKKYGIQRPPKEKGEQR